TPRPRSWSRARRRTCRTASRRRARRSIPAGRARSSPSSPHSGASASADMSTPPPLSGTTRSDFLNRIADDRRRAVEAMKLRTPAHELRARLVTQHPAGRLERALRRDGGAAPLRMICEVKRASPSRGPLNPGVDPVATARLYEAGGASAISLVTEPAYFGGELEWIDRVRPATRL